MEDKVKKIESSIETLKSKKQRIYFFVQDTKGNATGSIRYIYQMAMTLMKSGYNPIILHEKQDYYGVQNWLGEEYMTLPHRSIENQNLEISPEDIIVVPEIFGYVLPQINNLPCGKVILCQAYDHMFETLQPGQSWTQFGFSKCITTSVTQKDYLSSIMKSVSYDIIPPVIGETFTKSKYPQKPTIAILSRDQRDSINLIKTFYQKYPQFRWITFRDMRGITQEDFAKFLKDSFVSVWVDDVSGFGTFPLESMASGTPVIGKVPNLKPGWMEESNGIWTYQINEIIDILANYTQNWLEDNISPELYEKMLETSQKFQDTKKYEESIITTFNDYFDVRTKLFSDQIDKLKISEEQN
jgi:glycosyltransferase involved in cell wall biosynthesis